MAGGRVEAGRYVSRLRTPWPSHPGLDLSRGELWKALWHEREGEMIGSQRWLCLQGGG